MSTAGISSSSFFASSPIAQFMAEFKQLGQDLKSGNLSAAEQDFVTLSQEAEGQTSTTATTQSASATASSSTNSTESTLAADFQTLGQDLQSGNLSGAQQAFAQIQQAVGGDGGDGGAHFHGHHHGHGGGESQAIQVLQAIFGSSSTAGASSSSSSNSTSSSTSSSSSTTAAATNSTSASTSSTGSSSSSQSSPVTLSTLKQDFEALGSALESGDLSSAQQAFSQFTQDMSSFTSAGSGTQSSWSGGGYGESEGFGQIGGLSQYGGFGGSATELWQAFLASQDSGSTSTTATSGSAVNTTA